MRSPTPWLAATFLVASGWAQEAQQPPSAVRSSELVRHYEQVERELLSADVTHLTEAQRAQRQRAVSELRTYRQSRDFGVNEQRPEERRFYFVDADGRRCAVAHLLDVWGREDLTKKVAQSNNGALVVELSGDPEFQRFLSDLGLSVWEAARIQGPARNDGDRPPPGNPPGWNQPGPGADSRNAPSRDTRNSRGRPAPPPGDVVPTPRTETPSNPGSAPTTRPAPGIGPTTRGTAPTVAGSRGTPRGMAVTVGAPETWEVWWSWNRLGFLDRASAFTSSNPVTQTTGDDGGSEGLVAALRLRAEARILPWLAHDEPRLRAAAAFALGEFGSAGSVDAIVKLLADAHVRVRQEAILALGRMALPRAAHTLLRIANHGELRFEGTKLGFRDDERALAVTALAMAQRRGCDAPIASTLEHLVRREGEHQQSTIGAAALVHAGLVPQLLALARARDLASREDAQLATRIQAIRSLAGARDGESLATLVRTLADANLDVRIASALALAGLEHDLALPSLLTAYEVEREQRTRGMLLLAIGEHGSEVARAFLVKELEEGPRALRTFAALGLGILARADAEAVVAPALVRAYENEKNRGARSAYVIALGLARAEDALLPLVRSDFAGGSATERAYAGQALAFLGTAHARETIAAQIEADPCPTTRLSLCESLGYVPGAAIEAIGERIAEDDMDEWRHALARSLGWNVTSHSTAHVISTLEREDLDPTVLAGYVEAAGWLLTRHPEATPAIELARHTHPEVFPQWMGTAFVRVF